MAHSDPTETPFDPDPGATGPRAAHPEGSAATEQDTAQADTINQIATALAAVASGVRPGDLDRVTRTAGRVARDHPALFLGGAALLGFAAARLMKAQSPSETGPEPAGDPWATGPNLTSRGSA